MSTPYTHEAHYARCVDAARLGQVPPMPLVQIMRRGVHYCGQLVRTWTTPSGLDCWTVDVIHPERARYTVPCKQVRLCGDERCICTGFSSTLARGGFCQAGVVAPPDSLMCETNASTERG